MNKEGRFLRILGLLFLAAALFLTVKNLREDEFAGEQSEIALEELQQVIQRQADQTAVEHVEIIDEDGNYWDITPDVVGEDGYADVLTTDVGKDDGGSEAPSAADTVDRGTPDPSKNDDETKGADMPTSAAAVDRGTLIPSENGEEVKGADMPTSAAAIDRGTLIPTENGEEAKGADMPTSAGTVDRGTLIPSENGEDAQSEDMPSASAALDSAANINPVNDKDGTSAAVSPEDLSASHQGRKLWLRDAVTGMMMEWQETDGKRIPWEDVIEMWRQKMHLWIEENEKMPDFIRNPQMEMPVSKVKGNYYIGTVDIPMRKISLPVMSDWSYPKLRVAPCRYGGSVYSHDIVIAGHNYWRHFTRIKNMTEGEEVIFTDMDGNVFRYAVTKLEILQRTEVERLMTPKDWDLTMFTCNYGGRNRVAVRCKLIEIIPAG